jgi:hypothetical protein
MTKMASLARSNLSRSRINPDFCGLSGPPGEIVDNSDPRDDWIKVSYGPTKKTLHDTK